MKIKVRCKEWLFLFLPSLFLLCFGGYLKTSREQPFALVAERMVVAPSTAMNGYDTEVTLVMIPKGSWPEWLNYPPTNAIPNFSWAPDTSVFYSRNNTKTEFIWPAKAKSAMGSVAIYDKKQNRFITHTWLNLVEVPKNLGKLICEMKMTLLRLGSQDYRGRYKTTVITSAKSTITLRP